MFGELLSFQYSLPLLHRLKSLHLCICNADQINLDPHPEVERTYAHMCLLSSCTVLQKNMKSPHPKQLSSWPTDRLSHCTNPSLVPLFPDAPPMGELAHSSRSWQQAYKFRPCRLFRLGGGGAHVESKNILTRWPYRLNNPDDFCVIIGERRSGSFIWWTNPESLEDNRLLYLVWPISSCLSLAVLVCWASAKFCFLLGWSHTVFVLCEGLKNKWPNFNGRG